MGLTIRKRRIPRRMVIVAATGLALACAAQCFQRCWLSHPVGNGPAGPSVSADRFRAVWSERSVVLLGIGDSVTAGFGAAPGKSYVARLAQNPPDEFPDMEGICLEAVLPRQTVRNVAVSGSNSVQHATQQSPSLTPFPPDVFGIVVMTTGGNDLIHWYGKKPPEEGAMYGASFAQAQPWIAGFDKRLDTMLESIRALFPGGCHIFVGNIYDPSDGGGNPRFVGLPPWPDAPAILAAYNDTIVKCAARHEGVSVVDIHSTFLGHGVRCRQFWRTSYRREDPHYWYSGNIEDPNERGYDAIRRLFLLKMLEALGEDFAGE